MDVVQGLLITGGLMVGAITLLALYAKFFSTRL